MRVPARSAGFCGSTERARDWLTHRVTEKMVSFVMQKAISAAPLSLRQKLLPSPARGRF